MDTAVPAPVNGHEFEFSDTDFDTIRTLIYRHAGITLADSKRQLVYSRLSARLRTLGLRRFCDYIAVLNGDRAEWEPFTNALTTNLTAFFREQYHFPLLADHVRTLARRPLRLWSAATSTGEEAYSMAITMANLFGTLQPPVRILASDLDTRVLETARAGIYSLENVDKLPQDIKKKFFRRGRGERAHAARVIPELQKMVVFQQFNLLDAEWGFGQRFDAIFCRNVMIYFDKATQRRLIEKFVRVLQPDGLFFAGHSESLFHVGDLLTPLGHTVYRPAAGARAARGGDAPA